ncbi:hypothetical protein NDU88_005350 [Pleurodeles waltl]|uniref:Uncharacterized protein n=1 Tax=Pleurodeles waltl TaxID=8319 RepID=A0AAV7TV43_PLEWA|nr:hypothetical protein NDU88_005350 [Pleurodeles waltl]
MVENDLVIQIFGMWKNTLKPSNYAATKYKDVDDDLFKEWYDNTEDCSMKLMNKLIKHAKRKMEQHTAKVEAKIKELDKNKDDAGVKQLLPKMEKALQDKDEEIMERKFRKYIGDRLDYQYGRIYTFANKYEDLEMKEKMEKPAANRGSESEFRSDAGSSADECPMERGHFHRKLHLLRMTMRQG